MNAHELKKAQTELRELEREANELIAEIRVKSKELERKQNSIESLKRKIERPTLIVTEHALLRYLERRFNLDLTEIETHLKTHVEPALYVSSRGSIPIGDGLKAVYADGKICSVVKA